MAASDPPLAPVPASLLAQLATVPDPRIDRTKHHQLVDILAITLLAVLCGAEGFTEVAQFGRAREAWLRTFLALPNGIPSHDTFTRVFARLDRHALAARLAQWAQTVAALAVGEVVAIDGKTVRRSHDRGAGQAALHLVSAWATQHQLVLGQVKTADHSNEITAIPELLAVLDVRGCTVTIDAIGCQQKIAAAIRGKHAHYVLRLKANQEWLYTRLAQFHTAVTADPERYWQREGRAIPHETHTTVEKGHGRLETRRYTAVSAAAVLRDRTGWTDLTTLGWVESERTLLSGPTAGTPDATARDVRFFISSLPPKVGPIAHAVRSHWGIENRCHWTLDVVFQEDQSRVRRDHGPANLATIRRWVLSLLRQDTTHKHGLKARRLNAAWDQDYLLKVLRFAAPSAKPI